MAQQPVEFDSNSDGSVSAYPEKREPSISVREPLLSEILNKVHGAKTKAQKIKILLLTFIRMVKMMLFQ